MAKTVRRVARGAGIEDKERLDKLKEMGEFVERFLDDQADFPVEMRVQDDVRRCAAGREGHLRTR